MENKSVSIIIPVYNAEKFLSECISSIVKIPETLDWELILIDDGSKDSSGAICDSFAAANQRVKVFHEKNSGVSAARNQGLRLATKDYISFVDADDWIDADAFAKAFEVFVELKAEVAFTPYTRVQGLAQKHIPLNLGETRNFTAEESREFLKTRVAPSVDFFCVVWRTFFKRSLVKDLSFDASLSYHEDVLFLIKLLALEPQTAVINTPFYFYRIQENSACFNSNVNSLESRSRFLQKLEQFAQECGLDLSFAIMRRRCAVYARQYARIASETKSLHQRFKQFKLIHDGIPTSEISQWKTAFFGKSFLFYVLGSRFLGKKVGFLFLLLRFL